MILLLPSALESFGTPSRRLGSMFSVFRSSGSCEGFLGVRGRSLLNVSIAEGLGIREPEGELVDLSAMRCWNPARRGRKTTSGDLLSPSSSDSPHSGEGDGGQFLSRGNARLTLATVLRQTPKEPVLLWLNDVSVGDGIEAWPSLSGESYPSSIVADFGMPRAGDKETAPGVQDNVVGRR